MYLVSIRNISLLMLIILVTACGGGSDGGDGLAVSIATNEINVTVGKNDPTPVIPNTRLTVSGGSVFVDATTSINGIDGYRFDCPFTSYCDLILIAKDPRRLALGTYIDVMTITACSDNFCNNIIDTFTLTITTIITEGGAFTSNPIAINIDAKDGVSATPVNLELSYAGGVANTWSSTVNYISGADWLTLSTTSGSATVTSNMDLNFNILPVGIYQADILFTSNGGDVSLTVPVIYTVNYVRTAPEQVSFLVDMSTPIAQFSRNIIVLSDFGAESNQAQVDWTASETESWMSISPSNGDTGALNQFTITLDQAVLINLDNGTYNGVVTLSSNDPAISNVSIPVSLHFNMPRITNITPYVGYANQANTAVLTGTGFSGISTADIAFGSNNNPTAIEALNDSSVRVTYPALSIGDYTPSVTDRFGNVNVSLANLKIQATPALPNVELVRSGDVEGIIYDEQRKSIYVLDRTNMEIERYQFVGNAWVTDSLVLGTLPLGFTLTKDGSEILVISSNLIHVDPVTFSISDTVSFPVQFGYKAISAMNDGQVLIIKQLANPYLYDFKAKSFTQLTTNPLIRTDSPTITSSLDGSRLYITKFEGNSSFYRFDANSDELTVSPTPIGSANGVKTDRTGSKVLLKRSSYRVYDSSFGLLGGLVDFGIYGAVLSPDGLTAYAFTSEASTSQLKTYDLTSPNTSGNFIATTSALSSSPMGINGVDGTISSDGKILIFAGKNLVVRNLP